MTGDLYLALFCSTVDLKVPIPARKKIIMATVDQTVRSVIEYHPTRFTNRTDVLHFLLCVIGNGYAWVDGAVVSESSAYDPKPWTLEEHETQVAKVLETVPPLAHEVLREIYDEEKAKSMKILSTLDERVHAWGPLIGQVYPQDDYALLMNIPGDVTPDWEQACEQVRTLVADSGWLF